MPQTVRRFYCEKGVKLEEEIKMNPATVAISVIIPVYNGAGFIPNILECLKSQTLQNFEVIFVNDGSQDNTFEVLNQIDGNQFSFDCVVIHQENGGVSAARNRGIQQAQGEYICFIDADDQISSDYLEVLYDALRTTGLQVAVGNITRDVEKLSQAEGSTLREYSSLEFLREFLYRGIRFSVCAGMFARDCFRGDRCFPVGYRYSEDVYLLWQIFALESKIVEVERPIYYYYNNPRSAMNAGVDIRRLDAIVLMKKLEPIIAELNPDFSPEFTRYVVARHHWSILWQAATMLDSYQAFQEYNSHFEMKKELKKLLHYPEFRISLSSALYILSSRLYYFLLRLYVKLKK